MRNLTVILIFAILVVVIYGQFTRTSGQPSGTQIVLVGTSNSSGAAAAAMVNSFIGNAASSGCEAISVGGYAAGGEGLVIGIPVLVDCPAGTTLNPDGT